MKQRINYPKLRHLLLMKLNVVSHILPRQREHNLSKTQNGNYIAHLTNSTGRWRVKKAWFCIQEAESNSHRSHDAALHLLHHSSANLCQRLFQTAMFSDILRLLLITLFMT